MERLTYEYSVGEYTGWEVHGVDGVECGEVCQTKGRKGCEGCPIQEAIDRLAAYEDTEVTPEEIKEVQEAMAPIPFGRFHDIMEAEQEGRILVLPFKPGTEYFGHCHVRTANPISVGRFYPPYVPTLGVNAWLTREEAEAALKKQEG